MNIASALYQSVPRGHLAAQAIIQMICDDYGISKAKLTSKGRQSKTLYDARRRAICLMAEMKMSTPEIAEHVNRDESVVRRIKQRGNKSASTC